MAMNITMDVSHLTDPRISGVGVYTLELIKALRAAGEVSLSTSYRLSRFKKRDQIHAHVPGARLWWPGGLGFATEVVHGPDFRVPSTSRMARVVTIHDLAFLQPEMTEPDFAAKKKRDLDRQLERHPQAIITVSNATREALIAYRPELDNITYAVHLGGDHIQMPASTNRARTKPYFLFVGNLEARKNVEGIVAAYELYCAGTSDPADLVLVGKPGFQGQRILTRIQASPQVARIQLQGYCSLAEIHSYYHHATALVYPSWVEGFGIPVVEALHSGCPVITSKGSSMQEIAEDSAFLVDPADTSAIARAMLAVEKLSPEERRTWAAKGRARAAHFTWAKCASQTINVYRQAVARPRY
ncbi:MAG: glycosyltransferase family 4 protein [Bdellovibrionales bacterium]|nr:glycosyltransferase family 4 protein [Bdellovibrionales bacterium]